MGRVVLTGLLAGFLAVTASSAWADDGKPVPPKPEPGTVKGLEPTPTAPAGAAGTPVTPPPPGPTQPADPTASTGTWAPTPEERARTASACIACMPEWEMPIFDPNARYQIPWTGQYIPHQRNWALFANESIQYDSNIYAAQHHVEDDFISNTSVGISYRRQGSEWAALASLGVTGQVYFDHSDEDIIGLNGILDAGWKGGCFYAGVTDRLVRSQNPVVIRDNLFVVQDQNLDPYWTNSLNARVGYESCRLRLEADYDMGLYYAETGVTDAFNNVDNAFHLRGDYYVSEKTSLGAYAGIRFLTYSSGTQMDFKTYDYGLSASWRPDAKWSFGLQAGGSTIDSDGGSDRSDVTGALTVRFQALDRFAAEFGWTRDYEASIGAADQLVDLFHLRGYWTPCFDWQVLAGVTYQIGDVSNPDPDGTRDYDLWMFDVNVHHQFDCHWGADLGYVFTLQDTTHGGTDFDRSQVTLGVTFAF